MKHSEKGKKIGKNLKNLTVNEFENMKMSERFGKFNSDVRPVHFLSGQCQETT